jgi:hypothetical protein
MNRSEFLHLFSALPLGFLRGDNLPRLQTFDIVSAFANAQDGDVVNVPPGLHLPTAPLSLRNKKRVTVQGNNACIFPYADFTGKPVLDLAGAWGCTVSNLFVQSPTSSNPVAAIVLGRTPENIASSNNILDGCKLEGSYSGATLYSVAAECNRITNCFLQTATNKPVIINSADDLLGLGLVEGYSNCVHWLDHCTIYNSDASPYAILHHGMVDDCTVEKCHVYLGSGDFIRMEGYGTLHFQLSNIRLEGNSNCLLVDNRADWASAWDISRISHYIQSDYVIHSSRDILNSRIDMTYGGICYAAQWLHLTNGAQLRDVDLIGNWTDKIVSS